MTLTGDEIIKSSKYGYNNSMSSCNVAEGGQSTVQYIEHEIKNNNALYTFGLTTKDYITQYDRPQYLVLVKSGVGLNAYDLGTSAKYTSYQIGDKVRVERQGSTITFKRIRGGSTTVLLTANTADANKDYFIKFNVLTQDVVIDANMLANFNCTYIDNANEENTINYTETTIYDGYYNDEDPNQVAQENCHILSESRVYFDDMGRTIQAQSRNKSDGIVWATATRYDGFGRAVVTTLPAPTNKTSGQIVYDDHFFDNTNGQPYSWNTDFDKDFDQYGNTGGVALMNQVGGVNNPTIVDPNSPLGAYYSTNNTDNPNQAITDYPYARTEYSLLTGAQRRVVGPGDAHRMGQGHEAAAYAMRLSHLHELYPMFGLGAHPFNVVLHYQSDDDGVMGNYDYTGNTTLSTFTDALMENKIVKTITIDADGKETVAFTDLDGNELATCLSGQVDGQNVHIQKVSAIIPVGQFRDIHIPNGGSINAATAFTQGECVGGSGSISFKVYDLTNDQELTVTDLTTLGAGLYRIANDENASVCIRVDYTLNYHNFSLNIYNPLKQVIASVPPIGVDYSYCDDGANALDLWSLSFINNPNLSTVPAHTELSLFKYDKSGQIEWSQTPDAGRAYFAYSKDGKLRFSQNVKQRNNDQIAYINYDRSGRPVETGIFNRTSEPGTPQYYFPVEYTGNPTGIYFVTDVNVVENPFAPSCSNCLTERSYTRYDVNALGSPRPQRFLMMRVSKTWDDNGNATYYSYDVEGRIKWTAKQVNGMSIKYTDMTYDLIGNVTRVAYQEDEDDQFIHHYAYNEEGEVQSSATEDYDGNIVVQTEYEYYQDKSVKSVDIGDGLQEMEYTYTIHGWLKGINLDQLNSNTASNKVFSMALEYYDGDYEAAGGSSVYIEMANIQNPSYSGNIAMWRWKTNVNTSGLGHVNGYYAYRYEYNHRNELKTAEMGAVNINSGQGNFTPWSSYKVSNLQYDLNGNITHLTRIGDEQLKVDQLTYNYKNGKPNQLDYIGDAYHFTASNFGDLKNQSAGNYTYSEIGELIQDNADNITIQYSSSGKVTSVKDKTTGQYKIKYFYDESDLRVKKEGYNNGVIQKTTYYLGASIYIDEHDGNGILQKEVTINGGGRIGIANISYNGSTRTGINYTYEITDHLGNVRAVIQDNNGNVDVTYYADYYPFGWTMPGRNGGTAYRYAYQGQEKDPETGWEAFELRMYDGRVGRWMTTDPYSEFHSPYLAMGNSPIGTVDPDGGHTGQGAIIESEFNTKRAIFKTSFTLERKRPWACPQCTKGVKFKPIQNIDVQTYLIYSPALDVWHLSTKGAKGIGEHELPNSSWKVYVAPTLEPSFGDLLTDNPSEVYSDLTYLFKVSKNSLTVSPSVSAGTENFGAGLELGWEINGGTFADHFSFKLKNAGIGHYSNNELIPDLIINHAFKRGDGSLKIHPNIYFGGKIKNPKEIYGQKEFKLSAGGLAGFLGFKDIYRLKITSIYPYNTLLYELQKEYRKNTKNNE
jgi:RHS repeat-associated protein